MFFLLLAVLKELVNTGRLKGSVVGGRQDKAVYIPDIYAKTQNSWVDSFLQQNGYLGRLWEVLSTLHAALITKEKHWAMMCVFFHLTALTVFAGYTTAFMSCLSEGKQFERLAENTNRAWNLGIVHDEQNPSNLAVQMWETPTNIYSDIT